MPDPTQNWVGSYLGNALGCALGCFLLLNSGLMPQFSNAINAISVTKISYSFKEASQGVGGGRGWGRWGGRPWRGGPAELAGAQHNCTAVAAVAVQLAVQPPRQLSSDACHPGCVFPADLHQGSDGQLVGEGAGGFMWHAQGSRLLPTCPVHQHARHAMDPTLHATR